MKKPLRWGILGTGAIAKQFARELPFSTTGRLVAVGSRSRVGAERFAAEFSPVKAHAPYDALLGDPDVDAVYVSTPHPFHAQWTIASLQAGKHVLCEKPMATNLVTTMEMIDAARTHRRFLMEAFTYRCHPRTDRIVEIIRSNEIGRILLIEASFSFRKSFDPASRLFDPALEGGGILDVGCYTMSVARLIAGAACGNDFENPTHVLGAILPAPSGVDLVAAATLRFSSGILAQINCGVGMEHDQDLVVTGDNGAIRVPRFWNPPGLIEIRTSRETRTEPAFGTPYKYAAEADAVATALPSLESPFMSWDDSIGNAAALDAWLASPRGD
jgi:predicted dehydrogenase